MRLRGGSSTTRVVDPSSREDSAAGKHCHIQREHFLGDLSFRSAWPGGSSPIVKSFGEIVRAFIEYQRRHIMMEDRDFFPAALNALGPQDWTEIASALTSHEDPLFSEAAEETFDSVRAHISRLEQEADAERQVKHPPAKPWTLGIGPPKAAMGVANATPGCLGHLKVASTPHIS